VLHAVQAAPDAPVAEVDVLAGEEPRLLGARAARRSSNRVTADSARGPVPLTSIRERVARIWQEVLDIGDDIEDDDDFFHLGGHSVLAAQAVGRLVDAFQVDLSLRELFTHSTLGALASVIQLKAGDRLEEDS